MNISIDFKGLIAVGNMYGAAPLVLEKAIHSSIKSALYHIRLKLKSAIKDNEFGWVKLKPFPSSKGLLEMSRDQFRADPTWGTTKYNKPRDFFGVMGRLMFYNYNQSLFSGEVGAVNANKGQKKIGALLPTWWKKQQEGYDKVVGPDTRRFFGRFGFPIRAATTMFKIPARPLFGPVADKRSEEVNALLHMVILDKVSSGLTKTDFLDNMFTSTNG